MKSIYLTERHKLFTKQWHSHLIAKGTSLQVYLSRIQGDVVMHTHENGDEIVNASKTKGKNENEIIGLINE